MSDNNTNTHDDKMIPDPVIHEFVPPLEEQEMVREPLSPAEVEEEVGGDAPFNDPANMNTGKDEEEEKEEDPLLQ